MAISKGLKRFSNSFSSSVFAGIALKFIAKNEIDEKVKTQVGFKITDVECS